MPDVRSLPAGMTKAFSFLAALAAAAGGGLAVMSAAGYLPAALFPRSPAFVTANVVGSIPIDILLAAALLASVYFQIRWPTRPVTTALAALWSIIVVGVGAWLAQKGTWTWPEGVVWCCAIGVLVTICIRTDEWQRLGPSTLASEWSVLRTDPRTAQVYSACLLVCVSLAGLNVFLSWIGEHVEQDRNFRRWYTSAIARSRPAPELLVPGATATVVAFATYPWTLFPNSFAARLDQIDQVELQGLRTSVVIRHFPLDPDCNPYVLGPSTGACEAAAAVVAMELTQGSAAAREMTDWLLARTTVLSPQLVQDELERRGVWTTFQQVAERTRLRIREDVEMAHALGVTAVPAYFLNGMRLPPGQIALTSALGVQLERQDMPTRIPLDRERD